MSGGRANGEAGLVVVQKVQLGESKSKTRLRSIMHYTVLQ